MNPLLAGRPDRAGKEDGAGRWPELEQEACHWGEGRGWELRLVLFRWGEGRGSGRRFQQVEGEQLVRLEQLAARCWL